jgi:hypothetical protein
VTYKCVFFFFLVRTLAAHDYSLQCGALANSHSLDSAIAITQLTVYSPLCIEFITHSPLSWSSVPH